MPQLEAVSPLIRRERACEGWSGIGALLQRCCFRSEKCFIPLKCFGNKANSYSRTFEQVLEGGAVARKRLDTLVCKNEDPNATLSQNVFEVGEKEVSRLSFSRL